jgi:hypothetical protein
MDSLLKKRLLNEQRYFLNKTNSKWISIGIVPGYQELNNTNFKTAITIAGESGGVSLNVNGLKTVIHLFKSISYFSRFGPPSNDIEMERGVLMSEFQMGGTPCYKILNQATNTTVCMGLTSVEELLEMEQVLFGIINDIDVQSVEAEFLMILDKMSKNWDEFYKKSMKKTSKLAGQLLLNFYDFVMVCVELRKERLCITGNPVINDDDEEADEHPPSSPSSPPSSPPAAETGDGSVHDDDDGDDQAPVVKRAKYVRKYLVQKKAVQK